MKNKLCANCNNEISENDYFCPFCGNIIDNNIRESPKKCSICGDELKESEEGEVCKKCLKNVKLVPQLKKLLKYVKPGHTIKESKLTKEHFDELELNLLILDLLNENLIFFSSESIILNNVNEINSFLEKYGDESDIIKETEISDSPVISLQNSINLIDYPDYVRILFNSRINKWELNFLKKGKHVLRKHFISLEDANKEAIHYLKEEDVLNKDGASEYNSPKNTRSKIQGIFFSETRNMWGVRIRGYRGSRVIGYYDTESEAIRAKEEYLEKKSTRPPIRPVKKDIEGDTKITFSERANQWVVRIPRRRGGYKKLGYYDSEDEYGSFENEYDREE